MELGTAIYFKGASKMPLFYAAFSIYVTLTPSWWG
jgi:hypothetical protein